MAARLYYNDSYTSEFNARVLERLNVDGQPALVLDGTYFYPASGGQPADSGTINGTPVVDLRTRDEDGAVLHLLAQDVLGETVNCCVDWGRRFDHMQHHTGQHILTQAFVQVADAHTVGFHLSPDSVTIDLNKTNLSAEIVAQAEDLANRIVWDNRPVTAQLVAEDEAADVRMRKKPGHLLTGGLRVIEIEGFDKTACGGTHVARTGEIGVIKVLKLERRGDKTRVEFRCGGRALRDYQQKNAIVNAVVATLTCKADEIEPAVLRLQDEIRNLSRSLKAANAQLIEYEADRLLHEASQEKGIRIVRRSYDGREASDLKLLASRLVEQPKVVALLGSSGDKAQLVLGRSADLPFDMNAIIRQALPLLGQARGGGPPALAQGGGVQASAEQVQAALDAAEQALKV
ncbi:MAG: alanyl-tRNA editing protein [Chloroflexi bacterium]|nr:alanyl-tRNA editing protein [Chloroflexota bacterium]